MRHLLAAISATFALVTPGEADQWAGFYRPSVPVQAAPAKAADDTACLDAIFAAQERYGIPDNLLLAIGLQEAGRNYDGTLTVWPWTANLAGKGLFFNTEAELLDWLRNRQQEGRRSIDVGCMQINQKWHPDAFATPEEAADPVENVDYAARFLKTLHAQSNDWWLAAGRYHSHTAELQEKYLSRLSRNMTAARLHAVAYRENRSATLSQAVEVAKRPAPRPFGWASDMTGLGANRSLEAYSIYSSQPLQAVLPSYAVAVTE